MDAIWFFLGGLMFVLAFFGAGWWGWPRLQGLSAATRFTVIATATGGLIGALFWWQDLTPAFAWDLPPLASRLLGAAATAFGAGGVLVLLQPSAARAWLHDVMTAIYLLPLLAAVLLLHLDRFDYAAPVTWGFFVAVLAVGGASIAGVALDRPGDPGPVSRPFEAGWHVLAGVLLGIWAGALFVAPATPVALIFLWPADPLTSRLIAAMLMTLAAAMLIARGRAGLSLSANLVGAIYGWGGVAALAVNMAAGLSWPPAYLAVFGLVGAVSTALLLSRR